MLDLDTVLAHACPAETTDDPAVDVYHIEVHCVRFVVKARLLTLVPKITFKVLDVRTESY